MYYREVRLLVANKSCVINVNYRTAFLRSVRSVRSLERCVRVQRVQRALRGLEPREHARHGVVHAVEHGHTGAPRQVREIMAPTVVVAHRRLAVLYTTDYVTKLLSRYCQ